MSSWPVRVLVAAAFGLVLACAFEPVGLAVLLPVGVAGLMLAVHRASVPVGLLAGLAFGVGFMCLHLDWMTAVSTDVYLMLALFQALYFAPLGAALALVSRLAWWPWWSAFLWVVVEGIRGSWPFGGFPWGRLAYGTAGTPYAEALPYVGATGVSLLLALTGTTLAWLVLGGWRRPLLAAPAICGLVLATLAPVWLGYQPSRDGSVTVAVVQGDVPGDGTDILYNHRQVTRNHVDATLTLAEDVAAGRVAAPDFVVWPENSTAIDPFEDPELNEEITEAVAAIGVPVLVGAMTDDPQPGHVLNQGIVWDPVTGGGDRYTKKHPVPFGEYIPWRESNPLTDRFSQLDLIPNDMRSGTRQQPLEIAGVQVADAICFDVAFDDAIYPQVSGGGQVQVVQTSNAMFVKTPQIDQQFEITRLRARETGRAVAVAATNGITGIVLPDGSVSGVLERQTQGYVVRTVPVSDQAPWSLTLGPRIGVGVLGLAILGLLLGWVAYRRRVVAGDDVPGPDEAAAKEGTVGATRG